MEFLQDNVIAGIITFILGAIGIKFRGIVFSTFLPKAIKYSTLVAEIVKTVLSVFKAMEDKKITKEEVAEIRERAHKTIDLWIDTFEKKKAKYEPEPTV